MWKGAKDVKKLFKSRSRGPAVLRANREYACFLFLYSFLVTFNEKYLIEREQKDKTKKIIEIDKVNNKYYKSK